MSDTLSAARLDEILEAARALEVLVVGDLVLDEYWVGRADRLSREGPVPVLLYERRFQRPGGAANPAWNLAALGVRVRQVGVVGADDGARDLDAALADAGIDARLVRDPSRPTTRKTRIVAEGLSAPQQVARIDRQERAPIEGEVEESVLQALREAARGVQAVLASHYRSGVVTTRVAGALREAAAAEGALATVDAQGELERFASYDLVRVGRGDAARNLLRPLETEDDFREAAQELRARLDARAVLLGRGAEGTSLAEAEGYAVLPPANVSEVFDVTGAGDTVIALATLGLAAGASLREAVALANLGAGVVVRHLGVAAPTADELRAALRGVAEDAR